MRKIFLFTLFLGLGLSTVYAGGYRVALQGVRQASMGLTGVMQANDASVAFYNPAGLAFLDSKLSIAAGGFGIKSKVAYQDPKSLEKAESDNPIGTPIYFAASYKPVDELAVGVSFATPFGNTLKWPNDWAGASNITTIELKSYFIQPTVAYKFTDWFSVGAGFIYALGSVDLQRNIALAGNTIGFQIEEKSASGTGFNLGAFFRPSEKVDLGIAYRSKIDMKAEDGNTHWTDVPSGVGGNMPFSADRFNAALPLVSEFSVGLSYRPISKLMLAAEVAVSGWGKYRSLDIELVNSQTGESVDSKSTKNFKDRAIYKIGAEYEVSEMFSLRGGYYFDEYVTPDEHWSPETPDISRHGFNIGAGVNFGNFNVDVMGQYVLGVERSFNNPEIGLSGNANLNAFTFGLGLSYNLN